MSRSKLDHFWLHILHVHVLSQGNIQAWLGMTLQIRFTDVHNLSPQATLRRSQKWPHAPDSWNGQHQIPDALAIYIRLCKYPLLNLVTYIIRGCLAWTLMLEEADNSSACRKKKTTTTYNQTINIRENMIIFLGMLR